jgi:DNA-damage-inducible protein J
MSGTVRARVGTALKEDAEAVLRRLGLNPSEAIRLFYAQIALRQGMPFPIEIPNKETIRAMRDVRERRGLTTHTGDTAEMLRKLGR